VTQFPIKEINVQEVKEMVDDAAGCFTGQGFEKVYSMTGGFEGWMMAFSGSVEAP